MAGTFPNTTETAKFFEFVFNRMQEGGRNAKLSLSDIKKLPEGEKQLIYKTILDHRKKSHQKAFKEIFKEDPVELRKLIVREVYSKYISEPCKNADKCFENAVRPMHNAIKHGKSKTYSEADSKLKQTITKYLFGTEGKAHLTEKSYLEITALGEISQDKILTRSFGGEKLISIDSDALNKSQLKYLEKKRAYKVTLTTPGVASANTKIAWNFYDKAAKGIDKVKKAEKIYKTFENQNYLETLAQAISFASETKTGKAITQADIDNKLLKGLAKRTNLLSAIVDPGSKIAGEIYALHYDQGIPISEIAKQAKLIVEDKQRGLWRDWKYITNSESKAKEFLAKYGNELIEDTTDTIEELPGDIGTIIGDLESSFTEYNLADRQIVRSQNLIENYTTSSLIDNALLAQPTNQPIHWLPTKDYVRFITQKIQEFEETKDTTALNQMYDIVLKNPPLYSSGMDYEASSDATPPEVKLSNSYTTYSFPSQTFSFSDEFRLGKQAERSDLKVTYFLPYTTTSTGLSIETGSTIRVESTNIALPSDDDMKPAIDMLTGITQLPALTATITVMAPPGERMGGYLEGSFYDLGNYETFEVPITFQIGETGSNYLSNHFEQISSVGQSGEPCEGYDPGSTSFGYGCFMF